MNNSERRCCNCNCLINYGLLCEACEDAKKEEAIEAWKEIRNAIK